MCQVDDDATGEIEFPEFCALMGLDAKGQKAEAKPPMKREATMKQRKGSIITQSELVAAKPTKKELKAIKEAEMQRKREEDERLALESAQEWSSALSTPYEASSDRTETFSAGTFGYDYILHRAAKEGDEETVVNIVEGRGANARSANELDDMGWTPLMWATSMGQPMVSPPNPLAMKGNVMN